MRWEAKFTSASEIWMGEALGIRQDLATGSLTGTLTQDEPQMCRCPICAGGAEPDQARHSGAPMGALNSDDRGDAGLNGKPSLTVAEAAAQIGRFNTTWNGSTLGQAADVTYAFRASAPATMPNNTAGFSVFNAAQIEQTKIALQAWSDVARITFTQVTGTNGYSNNAQMLFGNYSSGAKDAAAFAYYPGNGINGDSWYNSSFSYNRAPDNLNYGGQVLIHEIGHAIGLAHPGAYNAGNGVPTYANNAEYYEDTRQYSVMSYWSETNTGGDNGGFYAAAPLLDDIAAVQRLYGANMTTRTGDTVYGFNSNTGRDYYTATASNTPVIFAIWDAGGIDTLDFSGYTQNQLIDLHDGAFSNVGGLTGNVAIGVGVTIENANGGSGADVIIGNEVANVIRGNAGNDRIEGGGGADLLYGGTGADVFVYRQLSDSTSTAIDRLLDFTSGTDRIDLSAIDANPNVSGDQAFTRVSAFSGAAGQITFAFNSTTGFTRISVDADGDRVPDMVIDVRGQINTSVDVIL
ncbi:serralysin family metalloprotease [uncultured Sphingomonas sp.]|uniref:serralysin family metalloprotease n=1 Tax=uncultured Sphingomonas sp. TaxID=158754 RepID=UPI0025F7D804|nr:serralysin family metalloprotease [uncultured Sphingomonas sp.]